MDKKNTIKIYTTSGGAELNISAPSAKQLVSATNNRAQFFAEQAKAYRDEAKEFMNNAKYYAEKNSDVSFEYINNVKFGLETVCKRAKIKEKNRYNEEIKDMHIPSAKVSAAFGIVYKHWSCFSRTLGGSNKCFRVYDFSYCKICLGSEVWWRFCSQGFSKIRSCL